MNPAEHVPNEQQEQIMTLLRQGGEMAESVAQTLHALAPLLAELPERWYDWPCDRYPYPATCNTAEDVAELCTWCAMQAIRPYAEGYRAGQVVRDAMPEALPSQQEPEPRKTPAARPAAAKKKSPVKKAAAGRPSKRAAKKS